MFKYITESNNKIQDRKEYNLYNVPVYIVDKYPDNIKVNNIIEMVKSTLPPSFFEGLEVIYVGDFPELNQRDIQAMLKDGAIWLSSNNVKNFLTEPLIAESIIHEVAHLIEGRWKDFIYGDGAIESEYNGKKQRLLDILKAEGESGAVESISFYEFTVGTTGEATGDELGPLKQMRRGTPQGKTNFYAENYLGQTENNDSPRFEIPVGQVKDLQPVATLQFGSQEELREIANKYASQLQDELVIIFNRLSDLTNNINKYTLDNDQNAGLQASSNASDLYRATRVLVEDK